MTSIIPPIRGRGRGRVRILKKTETATATRKPRRKPQNFADRVAVLDRGFAVSRFRGRGPEPTPRSGVWIAPTNKKHKQYKKGRRCWTRGRFGTYGSCTDSSIFAMKSHFLVFFFLFPFQFPYLSFFYFRFSDSLVLAFFPSRCNF